MNTIIVWSIVEHFISFFAAGMDYTIDMADLTVNFPAGAPVERCVPFIVIDDDLAREGNETFRFTINPNPLVNIIDPDEAEVTIIENDFGKLG